MLRKKSKKIIVGLLTTVCFLSLGAACKNAIPDGEEYVYNNEVPFYSECDAFMTLDGKFDEPEWENCNWISTTNLVDNDIVYKMTTTFTMKGLYVGMIGYDSNITWDARHNYPSNTYFMLQIAKEDELHWGSYPLYNHPMRDAKFFIDAKNALSLRERQFNYGCYVEGELNSKKTEYISAELFISWEDMNYTEEELGEDGMPDCVKIWSKFAGPGRTSPMFGFSDEKAVGRYYNFTKTGCILDETSPYIGSIDGYTCASEGWSIDHENKTVEATTNYTQLIYFKQDSEGNPFSAGTDYIAEVTVKAVEGKSGNHAGIMLVSARDKFNFYTASISSLTSGGVSILSGHEMDGGGWTSSYTLNKTVHKANTYDGNTISLKLIKHNGYLYYFCNGEYITFEYAPQVVGRNIVGLYANGPASFSDWSVTDYSENPDELKEILSENVYFATMKKQGQGSISLDRVAIPRNEGTVEITIEPLSGYVLTDLAVNGESIYDEFISNAVDGAYIYTTDCDIEVVATFKKLPSDEMKSVKLSIIDDKTSEGIVGVTATLKNSNSLLCVPLSTNMSGNIIFSVLAKGSYTVDKRTISTDGIYTLEVYAEGYLPKIYTFSMDKSSENLEDSIKLTNAWGKVTLNDSVTNTTGAINLYDETTGYYGIDYGSGVKQYLLDTVTSDAYAVTTTVTVKEKVGLGNVAGVMISAGGSNYICLKSCSWEQNKLCVEVYNSANVSSEISVTGFSHNLGSDDGTLTFSFARYGGVIFVYNDEGELGFYMDENGLHVVGDHTINRSTNLVSVNKALEQFFDKGDENAIGLVQYTWDSAIYWFDVDMRTGEDNALEMIGGTSRVEMNKETSDYTITITDGLLVGDGYISGTDITISVVSKVDGKIAKALTINYSDGSTEVIAGLAGLDKNATTFVVTIAKDCRIEPIMSDAVNVLGEVNVNGMAAKTVLNPIYYDAANNVYGSTDEYSIIQYFADSVTNGDYVVNATVKEDDGAEISNIAGISIGFGEYNRIILKSASWETNRICLELRTSGYEYVEISITGFAHTLGKAGGRLSFKVVKKNNVLYVYDASGALGFTLSENGLALAASHTTSATADKLAKINEELSKIFAVGDENAIGIVSYKWSGGKNWFDIKITKIADNEDGNLDDGEVKDVVWADDPWKKSASGGV